jgi:hypothetical protein
VVATNTSIDQLPKDSPVRRAISVPRGIFAQLMLGGVFDRHPGLKVVFTELRADWIPATLNFLERYFADGHAGLAQRPREYWTRHVGVTPSSPRGYEIQMRHEIGLTQFMFGMDYQHPEGTWPNTKEWLRLVLQGVPEVEARLILGENAIAFFGLDRAQAVREAERIGPAPDDILGDFVIDPRLIANFSDRSGYGRPPENVDTEYLEELIAEDEAQVSALGT